MTPYMIKFVDPWWRPNSNGEEWKDDEGKAQESYALMMDCMRRVLRIVPRETLYEWRLTSDAERRDWIDEELELRGPGGEPRPFQGLGE